MIPHIAVRGLDEWRRDLRSIDAADEAKQAHREIGELVISRAEAKRQALQAEYPVYRKIVMRASANQRQVQVTVGPKEFGAAAEFGSHTHVVFGHPWGQDRMKKRTLPRWTGNRYTLSEGVTSGLMVLPTVAEHRDTIYREYLDAVDRATRRAFPE